MNELHHKQSTNTPPIRPKAYAGIWVRFAATVIDLLILAVPFSVFVSLLSVGMGLSKAFLELEPGVPSNALLIKFGPRFLSIAFIFFAVMSWLYFAISESSSRQATMGKRLLSIYVTDMRGHQISFARASVRFLVGRLLVHVPVCGVYYCLLDFACIGFTSRAQALHDAIAQSLVICKTGASVSKPDYLTERSS